MNWQIRRNIYISVTIACALNILIVAFITKEWIPVLGWIVATFGWIAAYIENHISSINYGKVN